MYKHILIATDGSELAAKAVTTGIELAKRLGARLTALTASEPGTAMMMGDPGSAFPIIEYEKVAADNAARILDAVGSLAKAAGVPCETVYMMSYPSDAIIDTAKSKGCDLIVMSSHGRRGIARVLLGSQAVNVLTHSTVPVLICR
jgi:nucleotide-binding universal stress UspA family protein